MASDKLRPQGARPPPRRWRGRWPCCDEVKPNVEIHYGTGVLPPVGRDPATRNGIARRNCSMPTGAIRKGIAATVIVSRRGRRRRNDVTNRCPLAEREEGGIALQPIASGSCRPLCRPLCRPTERYAVRRAIIRRQEQWSRAIQQDTEQHRLTRDIMAAPELQNLHRGFESRTRLQTFQYKFRGRQAVPGSEREI